MSDKIKNVRYALVALLLFFCAVVQAQTVSGNVKDALGDGVIGVDLTVVVGVAYKDGGHIEVDARRYGIGRQLVLSYGKCCCQAEDGG